MDDDLDNMDEQERNLSPALYEDFDAVARYVIGTRQRKKLRHLLTFSFKKHSRYNLQDARLKRLESMIQEKARSLLE